VEREFRTVPLGRKQVLLGLPVQRLGCRSCGAVRQERIDFAEPKKHYTRIFERYVVELSRRMTMKDVADHLGLSWNTVKEIQKTNLQRRFAKPRLKELKVLAIDEIALDKGHRYLTLVVDWMTGRVVYTGDGKGADALKGFWKRLRSSHARIEAVAMDLSPAYRNAVSQHLPKAAIVFDRFHVIKLFNEKLADLRRDLQKDAELSLESRTVLKGVRWLLLKRPDNLDPKKNEKQRLQEALQLNQPLATAYYMKEDLCTLWDCPSKAEARKQLSDWIARANASGIPMLQKFAKTLAAHRSGILAYYDYALSTGPLEGLNNKIRTMNRQAYGFRDHEFRKLRILALHETKYALIG